MRIAFVVAITIKLTCCCGIPANADRIAPIDIVPSDWLDRYRHIRSDDSYMSLKEIETLTIKANEFARAARSTRSRTVQQPNFRKSLECFKVGQKRYSELKQKFPKEYNAHIDDQNEFVESYLRVLNEVGEGNSAAAQRLRANLIELKKQISKRGPDIRSYSHGYTNRTDMLKQMHYTNEYLSK